MEKAPRMFVPVFSAQKRIGELAAKAPAGYGANYDSVRLDLGRWLGQYGARPREVSAGSRDRFLMAVNLQVESITTGIAKAAAHERVINYCDAHPGRAGPQRSDR
ncbi:MAG: hypothetical protein KGH63_01775 [Candidatus Micrarchaeota archaeon]|nr:hypothetical protein [Candidatus Micrarchaeota archaeon]